MANRRLQIEAELALGTFRRILDELASEGGVAEQIALHRQITELATHSRLSIASQTNSAPAFGVGDASDPPTAAEAPPTTQAGSAPVPARVEVADGLFVEAMVLPESLRTHDEVLHAIVGPMLCYVPSWGEFAVRIGGGLIRGNVGNIYPFGTKAPMGVKPCCKTDCSDPGCRYYHDPLKLANTPQAADAPLPLRVRSFMAESFLYRPRNAPLPGGVRYGGRHFGNAGSLRLDLAQLSDAERGRFLSQVAHDLVCAAILLHNPPRP